LWLFATAMPVALALGLGGIQPRLAYVPAVGLALCLAATVQRASSSQQPLSPLTWTTLAVFLLACLGMGQRPLSTTVALALALCLWFAPALRPRGHSVALYLAAACLAYHAAHLLAPYAGVALVVPAPGTVTMPFVVLGVLWLLGPMRSSAPPHGEGIGAALLCSCAIFWTGAPALPVLLAVVLAAQLAGADPAYRAQRLTSLRWLERSCRRYGASAVAVLLAAAWLTTTYQSNTLWMRTGRAASALVAEVLPLLESLPQNACVEILARPQPDIMRDNRVQFDAVARTIADRPDLQILTPPLLEAAAKSSGRLRLPSPQYQVFWTADGHPRLAALPTEG
jgi:hypothetical protein